MADKKHHGEQANIPETSGGILLPDPVELKKREEAERQRRQDEDHQLLIRLQTRQADAQSLQAKSNVVIACLTAGLVVVSLIGGFVSYLQFSVAKKSADAATRAADAAEANIKTTVQISRMDQRAWIGITRVDGKINTSGSRIEIHVSNSGKTPAREVHAFHASACGPLGTLPPFGEEEKDAIGHTAIAPGSEIILIRDKFCNDDSRRIQDAIDGKISLYIYGTIWYVDAFGDARETQFCNVFNASNKAMDACKEHNKID